MTTHKLRIRFAGICSHFQGAVPGVPHRVVLPNATGVNFGLVRMQNDETQDDGTQNDDSFGSYYLLPHFPVVATVGASGLEKLNVKGVIAEGVISSPARLEIANPAETALVHDPSYHELLRSICHFVPFYQFSNEVVIGGRAAAYFDIFAGTVYGVYGAGGAINVEVHIETDGPPVLRVTPFGPPGSSPQSVVLSLGTAFGLEVLNSDVDVRKEDTPYDYLLHYLTSSRGIPQVLSHLPPGLERPALPPGVHDPALTKSEALPQVTLPQIAAALEGLAATIANHGPTHDQVTEMVEAADALGPSCSDTRYP